MKKRIIFLFLWLIFLSNIVYSSKEVSELDLGSSNSFQIKESIIEEKVLSYNKYVVDCLLQNVKTGFKIFVEAKAQDEVFFSKDWNVECNYIWCDKNKDDDLYFKVTYQFDDKYANTLAAIYIFLRGNENLQLDLKLDSCKHLDSNVEESKFISDLNYYEKKIFLMLNHMKFYLGDKIKVPICKESTIYTQQNLEKTVSKINNDFGKKYNLPIIQYILVDDLSSNDVCYRSIYEFLEEQEKKALEKISILLDNRESLFILNKLFYSKDFTLSQLNAALNNNNRFLYVFEDDKKLYDLLKQVFSKAKFIRPSVILYDNLINKLRYIILQKENKIIIVPMIILAYNKNTFSNQIQYSYEYLQKVQNRNYKITDIFNKKGYFELALRTDQELIITSKFFNNEDLLKKYLANYYSPIEIFKLTDTKIYVYVKSLDTVHDVFSWGFTRGDAPKSPIEVLKNLKNIENEIKAAKFSFNKVIYNYQTYYENKEKKSKKVISKIIPTNLVQACKDNFLLKLRSYNLLVNDCKIDICKIDYKNFDIFNYIYRVSECYAIDPLLVISLIARESDGINNFKERGAVGLGQFTTTTGEENNLLTFNNKGEYLDFRHHPLLNIGALVIYLRDNLDVSLKDSKRGIEDALWYYNFGQGNIIKYFSNLKSSKISEKINSILENAPVDDTLGNKKLEVAQYAPTIISYYLFYNYVGISKNDGKSFSKDINSLLTKYNIAIYFPQGEIK
ncbi:MAG: hypothetical protein QXS41_01795 [Candidatus Woesearchaeota archaeon]